MTENEYLPPSEALSQSEIDFNRKSAVVEMGHILLDQHKINMITDLYGDDIPLILAARGLSKQLQLDSWDELINLFLELKLSRDRKSRKELIDAAIGVQGKKPLGKRLKDVFKPEEN